MDHQKSIKKLKSSLKSKTQPNTKTLNAKTPNAKYSKKVSFLDQDSPIEKKDQNFIKRTTSQSSKLSLDIGPEVEVEVEVEVGQPYIEEPCQEILPGLWIGDRESAGNLKFLKSKDIKCIINCTEALPFVDDKIIVHKFRISVKDNLEKSQITKLYKILNNTVNKIYTLLPDHNILVHCNAGRQRSATVIAAYLMKFGNMSKKDAIEALQSKRLTAFQPGINFDPALSQFQVDLLEKF